MTIHTIHDLDAMFLPVGTAVTWQDLTGNTFTGTVTASGPRMMEVAINERLSGKRWKASVTIIIHREEVR